MSDVTSADLSALSRWDTPTICNGLELVTPERRAIGFTTEQMACLDSQLSPVVGYARTATVRAVTAPTTDREQVMAQRAGYYEHIAESPGPTISVIQDLDPHPGFGAFWGEVNTTVHKGLGCIGAVTNGSIRDLDACATGFQLLAGKIGPSHAHVHVIEYGCEVNIFSMVVNPGDIIHADRHGAVVIPLDAVKALPAAIDLLTRREAVILEAARATDFDINKLKQATANAVEIH
ncbi:MAG TPA: RraA family protein [Gammaproteobacteria bacterium]|jgi:regulator of RNase E activity RraA|nr:RraA family protein [Gammaproteobacteria bacterium]